MFKSGTVEIARGDDSPHTYGIERALRDEGPSYVLLRAHNHIWNEKRLPFDTRWGASHLLWNLDTTLYVGHELDHVALM